VGAKTKSLPPALINGAERLLALPLLKLKIGSTYDLNFYYFKSGWSVFCTIDSICKLENPNKSTTQATKKQKIFDLLILKFM